MVLAPALHAFTQAPQPMQFFGYTINCGLTDRVSGLWHQLHAMLHPLKNTVVREIGTEMSDLILDYFKQYGDAMPERRGDFRVLPPVQSDG